MQPDKLHGLGPVLLLLSGAGCADDQAAAVESAGSSSGSTSSSSGSSHTSRSDAGTETSEPPATGSTSSTSSGEPNDEPQAEDDQYVIFSSEMPLTVDHDAGLLANDADPDGDPLSMFDFDNPSMLGVDVSVNPNGSFTYETVGPWWGGPDQFSYIVSDGQGGTATADVSLLVVPDSIPEDSVREGVGGFAIEPQEDDVLGEHTLAYAGDINGDGFGDVLVGGFFNGTLDEYARDPIASDPLRAYVVFGKADGTPVELDDVADGDGGFVILGETALTTSQVALAGGGDVNNDGVDDIVIGVGAHEAARTYVVFGKADETEVDLSTLVDGVGGFVIEEDEEGDRAGYSVALLGDLNGDGLDDLAVGAHHSNLNGPTSGGVYVVFGRDETTPVLLADVASGLGGFVIRGAGPGDQAGYSIAGVGDVNGDAIPDILIGARGGTDSGGAYVVFGKADGTPVALNALDSRGFWMVPEVTSDQLGSEVSAAGDTNADGLADLLVGAPVHASPAGLAGRAYLVFGTAETSDINMSDIAQGSGGYRIEMDPTEAPRLGSDLAGGGDVNGDGRDDFVVGKQMVAVDSLLLRSCFVVHGKDDSNAVTVNDTMQGEGGFAIVSGNLVGSNVHQGPTELAAGGDINGDGFSDVLVSSSVGTWYQSAFDPHMVVVFGSPTSLP